MTLRILIADQSQARFMHLPTRRALSGPATRLVVSEGLTDPSAHLHDRDFKSDAPGRVFGRGRLLGGRRGALANHGVEENRCPRAHAAELFAHRIEDLGYEPGVYLRGHLLTALAAPSARCA